MKPGWIVVLGFAVSLQGMAVDFDEPLVLREGREVVLFSQNTSGNMAVDSAGTAHLVYTLNDENIIPPDNQVWHQSIGQDGIGQPTRVDNGAQGGGRQPSMAVDPSDTVHVVWQDYRHSTAAGRYFDNLEIYYDKKPAGGTFSDTDIRLTETQAGHLGDNGFVPQTAIDLGGRVHVVWYDFHFDNISDIYYRASRPDGLFTPHTGIGEFQITFSNRGDQPNVSNWFPDLGLFPDGSVYVVWGRREGWQGSYELFGGIVSGSDGLNAVEPIADQEGQFFDPPRLACDALGNLGLAASKYTGSQYHIQLHYKPFGQNWRPGIQIDDRQLSASQPCLAFGPNGLIHLVWQEDLGGISQIRYVGFHPESGVVDGPASLSSDEEDARTPTIAAHPVTGRIHVAWIRYGQEGERAIVYRRQMAAAVEEWGVHDQP